MFTPYTILLKNKPKVVIYRILGQVEFTHTVYPKKYAHGFVVLCFVVVMQSFIMNSHEVFIHIHQGCFAGAGAIVRLPQCQWSKPDGYGKISQCLTTTKHRKAKTCAYFLGYTVSLTGCHKYLIVFGAYITTLKGTGNHKLTWLTKNWWCSRS